MRTLAAVILVLIVAARPGGAQSQVGSGSYVIGGLVLAPQSDFDDSFEIRLLNDGNAVVETLRRRIQQQFAFKLPEPGVFYVEVEIPGFKKVRERIDLDSSHKERSLHILVEAQPVVAPKGAPKLIGEDFVVPAADIAPKAEVRKKFQDAEKKFKQGDLAGAQRRLESIVAEAPDFYDAHKTLGEAYLRSFHYREAQQEFEIAKELRPLSSTPLIYLGSLYLAELETEKGSSSPGGLDSARKVLLRAVELSPDAAFAHYLLGVTYYKCGEFSDAEKSLVHALELEPQLATVHVALANVYVQAQNWSKAVASLDLYLKENPHGTDREAAVEMRKRIEQLTAQAGARSGF